MPTGSCLCGDITYEYNVDPAVTALCHCNDCQKWSGGGGTSNVAIPTADFKIIKGTPKKFVTIGGSGKEHPHYFCGNCGSSLYSQPDLMEGTTLIKAGTLDGNAADIPVKVEFFTKDRRGFDAPVPEAQQLKTMS